MRLIGELANSFGTVDSPTMELDVANVGGRIRSIVGEIIDLVFPILVLLAIIIALITFLVGYFEFATSLNPHVGLRKGLRGIAVFAALIIVFGGFGEIELLAGTSIAVMDGQGNVDSSKPSGTITLLNDLMSVFGAALVLGLFIIAASSLVVLLWGLGQVTIYKPNDPERRTSTRVIARAVLGVLGVIVPLGMQFPRPQSLFPVQEAVFLLISKGGLV
jgi:hypothetical protein